MLDAAAPTSGSRATSRCTPRARSCCAARATAAADEAYARAIELTDNEAERTGAGSEAPDRRVRRFDVRVEDDAVVLSLG